jgi:hypothetical protein
MLRRRRLCPVCESKPAKKLESFYTNAIKEPAFCSRRCAAEYGLLCAGSEGDDGLNWCLHHGWYANSNEMHGGCPDCPSVEEVSDG